MPTVTREEIVALLGDVDDVVIADIIGTGATPEELAEAHAWIANDEPLLSAGRPLAAGRVARVVDILAALQEDEEPPEGSAR